MTVGSTGETAQACTAILDELERAVVGRRRTLELVLIGILAGGHVLLEDLPGLGKTLIARSFARVLGLDFARIQFTPDLLPSDVVGASLYDQRSAEMVFRPGPVFTQLLLADEINRTPPKTQAALLEAMGESQVSVDGQTRRLPEPFIVLATDNPIEYEGTYELPEAQLDRFLMRLRLGYLTAGVETAMLRRRPPRITVRVRLSSQRAFEGELVAVDVAADGQGDCGVRWTLHPGPEIATAGFAAADGARARFTFTPERWGKRQVGTMEVVLRDRWRLAEGHATVRLARLDCYPAPAQQQTRVVLRRLPNRLGPGPGATRRGRGGPRVPGGQGPGGRDYFPMGRRQLAGSRTRPTAGVPDHRLDAGQPGAG